MVSPRRFSFSEIFPTRFYPNRVGEPSLNLQRKSGHLPVRRILISLALVDGLLVWTHYYGWLIVAAQVLFLLPRRDKLQSFLVGCLLLVICYLPWVYAVSDALRRKHGLEGNLAWIGRPTLGGLVWFYATINGALNFPHSASLSLLLFCFPFAFLAWRLFEKRYEGWRGNHQVVLLLLLLSVLPPLAAFGASYLLPQSVWGDRHLIFIAVFYFLLESIAVFSIHPKSLGTALLILVVTWSTLVCWLDIHQTNKRIHWDLLVRTLLRNEAGSSLVRVYALETYVFAPLQYYVNSMAQGRFETRLVSDLASITGDCFWVAIRIKDLRNLKPPQELLRKPGYEIGMPTVLSTDSYAVVVFRASKIKPSL